VTEAGQVPWVVRDVVHDINKAVGRPDGLPAAVDQMAGAPGNRPPLISPGERRGMIVPDLAGMLRVRSWLPQKRSQGP
jgi:hypothetical protein